MYDGHMKMILKRLLFITEKQHTNPFIPFFVTLSIVAGIVIICIHSIPVLPEIVLFELFYEFLGIQFAALLWGVGLILSGVLHYLEAYFRNGNFGAVGAWMGLLLWSYILGAYIAEAFLFAGVMVMPFVFFWGWYLVKWRKYIRRLKMGMFPQIER